MSHRTLPGYSLSFSSVIHGWTRHIGDIGMYRWLSEHRRRVILVLLGGFVCLMGRVHAQVQPGFPAFSPQDCQFGICVNLANNNVTISAPIRHKSGAFPFRADLAGNYYIAGGSQWQPSINAIPGPLQAQVNDFINSNFQVEYTTYAYNVPCDNGGGTTMKFYNWVLIDAGGTVRQLPATDYSDWDENGDSCLNGSGFTAITTDGSGITVTVAPNGTTASGVWGKDGSHIVGTPITKVQDTFGNSVYVSGSAFYDTLNVATLSFSGGTQTQGPFSWTDVEGNTQTVTLGTTSETIRTNFGCTDVTDLAGSVLTPATSITFADGTKQSWTFNATYGYPADIDGRLSKITLPTQGTVTFTYGSGQNTIDCTYFTSDTVTKTLGNGDATTYTLSYGGTPLTITSTVVNPGGNKTVYTFLASTQQVLSMVHYRGSSTPLDYTYYCYSTAFSSCSPGSSGLTCPLLSFT